MPGQWTTDGAAGKAQKTAAGSARNRRLAARDFLSTVPAVIGILRLIGVTNAAVWFGATVFFTVAAAPAFFSPEMLRLLGRPHAGAAAQLIVARYFLLQEICATLAVIHLLVEWLYAGKPLSRLLLAVQLGLLALGLAGGLWLQPKLQELHRTMYVRGPTVAQAEAARRSFHTWHGVSMLANLFIGIGAFAYLCRVTDSAAFPRFYSANKFKS